MSGIDGLIAQIPNVGPEQGRLALWGVILIAVAYFAGLVWVKLGGALPRLRRRR